MGLPDWMKKKELRETPPKTISTVKTIPIMTSSPGISGTDYSAYLDKTMEAANLPGPDYYEFKKAIDALPNTFSEQQKYQAVYATLSSQGVDVAKLVNSAGEYQKVLDSKKVLFLKQLEDDRQTGVIGVQIEIQKLQEEIVKLSSKIQELTDSVNTKTSEANANANSLAVEENAFINMLQVRQNEISQNIQKIQTYLK